MLPGSSSTTIVFYLGLLPAMYASCLYGPWDCDHQCHCQDDALCDPYTGECPYGCDDGLGSTQYEYTGAWTGQDCQIGNIAYNKPAEQFGTFLSYYAGLAVDGNIDPELFNDHCAHPFHDDGSGIATWWQVDTKGEHVISSVTIYNRNEYPYRLTDTVVEVSSDKVTYQPCGNTGSDTDMASIEVTCPPSLIGRFLRLRREEGSRDDIAMGLCEVIVIGYSIGPGEGGLCECDHTILMVVTAIIATIIACLIPVLIFVIFKFRRASDTSSTPPLTPPPAPHVPGPGGSPNPSAHSGGHTPYGSTPSGSRRIAPVGNRPGIPVPADTGTYLEIPDTAVYSKGVRVPGSDKLEPYAEHVTRRDDKRTSSGKGRNKLEPYAEHVAGRDDKRTSSENGRHTIEPYSEHVSSHDDGTNLSDNGYLEPIVQPYSTWADSGPADQTRSGPGEAVAMGVIR